MASGNYQRALYNILGGKIVAYNAELAIALGGVKAGVLMGQLLYWEGKGKDKEWIYKTVDEFYMETALTSSEQEWAIKKCKEKGVLETKLARIPATRHFRVNKEKLIELLRLGKKGKLDLSKKKSMIAVNDDTTTYSTQENTSDIRKDIRSLSNKLNINFNRNKL